MRPINMHPLVLMIIWICSINSSTAAQCPYQDSHCSCLKDTVTCVGFDILPQPIAGWNDTSIQHGVFLAGPAPFISIPSNSFPPGLVSINITGNDSNWAFLISPDAFLQTVGSLKDLKLAIIGITPLPVAILTLDKLENLTIDFEFVREWYNDTNKKNRLPELTYLSLSVTLIENFSFDDLPPKLETVMLEYNRIENITYSPGSFLPPIKNLYLTGNQLTSVPDVVANLSQLDWLTLSFNKIIQLSLDYFPSSLTWLDLSNNLISHIDGSSIHTFSNLSVLLLNDNPIVSIADTAFVNLGRLSLFDLQGTELTRLPLALTTLGTYFLGIFLDLDPSYNLSCPCPPPDELIRWYRAPNTFVQILGNCSEGEPVQAYLTDFCNTPTTY